MSKGKNRLNESEDAVLARIEAFRARRPRFIDDSVTLAHGAGGKASAALIDAIFFEEFGSPRPSDPGDAAGGGRGRIRFSPPRFHHRLLRRQPDHFPRRFDR